MTKLHWYEVGDSRVYEGKGVLGESDLGGWYVPAMSDSWAWRPFNPWNPLHWRFYLKSRITKEIVWLETQ
jgi:hypothetical protein